MRALILDPEKIKTLRAYAEANRVNPRPDMEPSPSIPANISINQLPVGDSPNYRIYLFNGYRIVFSIEWQPKEARWFRHLSISVDSLGRVPHMVATETLAKEFGFNWEAPKMIWLEEISPNHTAVNVLQPLE